MCYMKNFDINELNGHDYKSSKKLLLNAGYSQKLGKINYEPCDEYDYAADIYFVKDSEDKLQEVDRICCTVYSDDYIYTDKDDGVYDVIDSDILKTSWEKDAPRITKAGVLANLKNFIGKYIDDEFDTNVCEAFEDYDEKGETCMSCEKSQDCSGIYIASIDAEYPTEFTIQTDSNNIITDVWTTER